jgi:5-methylcytosine-specific restriction enzyme subunit McrC
MIYCRYDEYTENNLINQIFKYTTHLLLKLTSDSENYKLLRSINSFLSTITLRQIKLNEFDKITLNRLNYYLEPLLNFAKLIISRSTVELYGKDIPIYSLIFDMEKLFEDFIAEYINKNRQTIFNEKTHIDIQGMHPRKYLVEQPNKLFMLKPDIIITSPNIELILDTKYKELDKDDKKMGVSQGDMYQMFAYAKKHNINNTMLLYPRHLNTKPPDKPYKIQEKSEEVTVHIKTIPLDINLLKEKTNFLKKIKEIFNLL